MMLDWRWVVGIGTVLVAIVVTTAMLMALLNDTLDAVSNAQDCVIELLLEDERTAEAVREYCPGGSLPEREQQ